MYSLAGMFPSKNLTIFVLINFILFHPRRRDHRTRANRARLQTEWWMKLMPRLTTAYVSWTSGIKREQDHKDTSEPSWEFPVYSFEGISLSLRLVLSQAE
jgi:hypothetical protein